MFSRTVLIILSINMIRFMEPGTNYIQTDQRMVNILKLIRMHNIINISQSAIIRAIPMIRYPLSRYSS